MSSGVPPTLAFAAIVRENLEHRATETYIHTIELYNFNYCHFSYVQPLIFAARKCTCCETLIVFPSVLENVHWSDNVRKSTRRWQTRHQTGLVAFISPFKCRVSTLKWPCFSAVWWEYLWLQSTSHTSRLAPLEWQTKRQTVPVQQTYRHKLFSHCCFCYLWWRFIQT